MNVRRTKILRDLLVNKSRSLLVILAVAVGVAAFGLMITGRVVLDENLRAGYASVGVVVPGETDAVLLATTFRYKF